MGNATAVAVVLDLPVYVTEDNIPVSIRWLYVLCDITPELRYPHDEENARLTCAAVFFLHADRSLDVAGLGANPRAREALDVLIRNLCGRGPEELQDAVDPSVAREVESIIDSVARKTWRS